MSPSRSWLAHFIGAADVERLNTITFEFTPESRIGLSDLLISWHANVSRLSDETGEPEDAESVWAAHDLIATLLHRDRIRELLPEVPSGLRDRLDRALEDADDRYGRYVEADECGCLERVDGRPAPDGAWWWRRVPVSGPVRAELERFYRHHHTGD